MPKNSAEMMENLREKFNGKGLLREIALFGSAIATQPRFLYVLILSITRCCIPFMVRWYEHGSPFAKFTVHSWIYSILDLFIALIISS